MSETVQESINGLANFVEEINILQIMLKELFWRGMASGLKRL